MAKSRKTREGNFIEDIVYHRLGSPSVAEDNVRATVTPEELKSITSQQAGHTSSWTCLSPLTSVHYLKDRLRGEPVGSEYKKTVPCSLFYNLHDAANPYEDGGTWGSFGDRMEDNVSKHHTVRISHLGNDETSGEVTKTEKKSSVELLDKMTVLSKWQSIVPVDHKQTNTDFAAETGIKTQLSDDCYKSSLATSGRDSSDGFSDTLLNDNRRKRSSPSEDSELLDISEGTSFLPDLETSSEAIHITDQWVSTSTVPYVEFRQSIKKNEVMSKSPKQILMPITPATAINDFSVRHYADEKQNAKSKVHHDPLQLQSTSHRLKSSEERDNVSVVNSTTMDATNSGQSDQRTASPSLLSTSSLATCKYLEWDSGADIGYEGPKVIYGLSPLERMAIGSYCSGIQRMEPEGNNSQLKDSLPANIQPEGLPNLDKLAAEEREKLKESKELEKLSPSPKMFLDVESPKSDAMHSRLHKETFSEWPISNRKPTCISLNPFCSTVVNDEDQCLPAKLSFHTPATNAHLPTTCTSANQCTSKKKNMCNMQDASSETSSSPHSTKKMSSKALAEQNDLATRSSNYDDQNVIFKTKKFVDEVCQKSDLSKKHCLLKKILEDLGTSLSNDDIVSLYHNSNVSQTFKRDVPLTEFLPRSTETMKTILPPYTAFTDSHRSECDSNHEANEESNSKDSYHDSGTIVVKPYR